MNNIQRAWLGLGANLDDPIQQIVSARAKLVQLPFVSRWICSSMYLSSPVGYSDQPNFINCVLSIDVNVGAQELFSNMQSIETNLGRTRDINNQNAPRKIDIDLLMFGAQSLHSPDLIIPHPRMSQRLFVLEPLLELGVDIGRDVMTDFLSQKIIRLTM